MLDTVLDTGSSPSFLKTRWVPYVAPPPTGSLAQLPSLCETLSPRNSCGLGVGNLSQHTEDKTCGVVLHFATCLCIDLLTSNVSS